MRKSILVFALVVGNFSMLFAQTTFQKGYFVDNNNVRTECLIKNEDWLSNPTKFNYKVSDDGVVQSAKIAAVQMFGIYNILKFIRANVNVDVSSDNTDNISSTIEPEWQLKTLFLKVLVEGKASLYCYTSNTIRFFYTSQNNDTIRELVYRSYLTENNSIQTNKAYLTQLKNDVYCSNSSNIYIQEMNYGINALNTYFKNYNSCVNSNYTSYDIRKTKINGKNSAFHVDAFGGIDAAAMHLSNASVSNWYFSRKLFPVIGIGLAYILPWNNNKWELLLQPSFHEIVGTAAASDLGFGNSNVKYSAIDLPIGLRYYSFLKNNSKIFFTAFCTPAFASIQLNKNISANNGKQLNIRNNNAFALGIGYSWFKKFSIEGQYHFSQNITSDYILWNTHYDRFVFIVSYRIL